MSFRVNEEKIIKDFNLTKFGAKGWYSGKELCCKVCGKSDKFGINFEINKVHCFYDDYKASISFYLKEIGRTDLIIGQESVGVDFEFPSFIEESGVIKEEIIPIKKLPIGFKKVEFDEYLESRNFKSHHYKEFGVGITKIDSRLKNDIVFQFYNKDGETIAWMSRSKYDKEWHKENLRKFKEGLCSLKLRYNNSPNTDFSKILGGELELSEETKILILVEGIMDKVNVDNELDLTYQSEIKCCFTFGNKVSLEQINIIEKYKNVEIIYLFYDEGTIPQSKHCGLLLSETKKKVYIAEIKGKGVDPGTMNVKDIMEVLEKSVNGFSFNYTKIDGIN